MQSAVLLPIGIWLLGTWAQHRMRVNEREHTWAAFARLHNGRFEAARAGASATIELEARGAAVHIELENSRGQAVPVTRARAAYALGEGPMFSITPEYAFSSVDKRLGKQDHTLGDPAFDERFVVGGSSALALRAVLARPLQELMVTHLRQATVSSDGLFVTVEAPRSMGDPTVLGALVDVVLGIASSGLAELEAIATLPGACWEPPSGPWAARSPARLTLERNGLIVLVAMRVSERGLRAELSLTSSITLPAIAVAIGDTGIPTGEAPSGLLPPPRDLLGLAGARLTASGNAARVRFGPGGAPSASSIEAAAVLLTRLARGPSSPFR